MERVAVIGFGNIAIRHRRNLKELFPGSTLYAMSASGRVPVEKIENSDFVVSSVSELISNNIQLVIVASPAPFHSDHAIPLIESGIPTFIEKPIAACSVDALAIQEAEKTYQTPVSIGYCLRYLPSAKKMKQIIGQGLLGDLYNVSVEIGQYLPDWRPTKDYKSSVSANACLGGGALLELSHEFDYVQWMLGPLSLRHAILRSSCELDLDVEDSVDVLALAGENTVVNIHLDFLQRSAYRQCRFVGSKGVVIWDLIENEIRFISKGASTFLYQEPSWDKNKMYLEMISDFVRKINKIENRSVGLHESLKTIALIEQIKKNYPVI